VVSNFIKSAPPGEFNEVFNGMQWGLGVFVEICLCYSYSICPVSQCDLPTCIVFVHGYDCSVVDFGCFFLVKINSNFLMISGCPF